MAKKPASAGSSKAKPSGDGEAKAIVYGPDVRVALFKGPDAYLRSAYTDKLREAIEKTGVPVDVIRIDGATAQVADVLDECRSFGLMRQHKLVVVEQADLFLKEPEDEMATPEPPALKRRGPARASKREMVEAYIQSPTEGATLVLRAESWHPGKIDKMIPSVGVVESCDAPTGATAIAAITRRAREKLGCEIEREAAQLLVERMGIDLGGLVNEIEKLSLFAGKGQPITVAMVRELVGISREEESWDFQGALMSGDASFAAGKVRELLEVSRVPEVMLRFVTIDLARKLHAFSRGMKQGLPPGAIARVNWTRDFALGNAIQAKAREVDPAAMAGLLKQSVEDDYKAKSGRIDHEEISLEAMAVGFVRATGG